MVQLPLSDGWLSCIVSLMNNRGSRLSMLKTETVKICQLVEVTGKKFSQWCLDELVGHDNAEWEVRSVISGGNVGFCLDNVAAN